jgi:hypothetical protein
MSSIQQFQDSLKDASLDELLAIIAAATAEAKKKAKIVVKAPKKEAKEKKGSMPKGVVPPQLIKPRAYVDYTLADANKNGWEAFEISGKPFAASVQKEDGSYIFEATGKPFNHKHAIVTFCSCMQPVNRICCDLNSSLKTKCCVCANDVVVNRLWHTHNRQAVLFVQH